MHNIATVSVPFASTTHSHYAIPYRGGFHRGATASSSLSLPSSVLALTSSASLALLYADGLTYLCKTYVPLQPHCMPHHYCATRTTTALRRYPGARCDIRPGLPGCALTDFIYLPACVVRSALASDAVAAAVVSCRGHSDMLDNLLPNHRRMLLITGLRGLHAQRGTGT